MGNIIEVNNLTMNFGGLRAIDQFNLNIEKGEIVALIGPNGAGKTTAFNCITGIYVPTGGEVFVIPPGKKRKKINGLKPNLITRTGLARTFQNIRLFPNMTALENIMIGRHCRTSSGVIGSIFRTRATLKEEKEVVERSYSILKKVGLESFHQELAKNLPYGAQKRLEIARAMATDPFLLLLDEPAAGLNVRETKELDNLINRIRDDVEITIFIIEHDMKLIMSISDRIVVMDSGKKIADGTPDEIKNNPVVIKAYLGEEFVA